MGEFRGLRRLLSTDLGPHTLPQQSTAIADCDDIDPCGRHRHTPRCDYALIYGSESRLQDDYQSLLHGEEK
jgi:hypothetical protein